MGSEVTAACQCGLDVRILVGGGMSESPGQHAVAEWNMQGQLGRELMLTDGNYMCPKCNKFSLRFSESCLWD